MTTKLIRSGEIVWQEMGEQAVLVHARPGERWTLNAVATAAWKLCDGSRSVDALSKNVS